MTTAGLPIANMLWIEGALGPVERACMRSVIRQGHRLILWHYGKLSGVPEGVELRDGHAVVPRERLFRHIPTGSYSLFSNLFRYRLLQQDLGLWLDCDAYLLKPIEWKDGHIYGFESAGVVASGVLALPADHPALAELISFFDGRSIPPWLPTRWRVKYAIQHLLNGRYRVETMPWGYLGPRALTAMLTKHGLLEKARPPQVFYPWDWQAVDWMFKSSERIEDRITAETTAVHLYNQMIRDRKNLPAPQGSFMERLQREGA